MSRDRDAERKFEIDFCQASYFHDDEFPEDSYFELSCSCGCGLVTSDKTGSFPFTIDPDYNKQFRNHFTTDCADCKKAHLCDYKCAHCAKHLCFRDHLTHRITQKLTGACKSYAETFPEETESNLREKRYEEERNALNKEMDERCAQQ